MPERRTPASAPSAQKLKRRIRDVQKECDALQAQLDDQANSAMARWLQAVQHESAQIRTFHDSVSWKVTGPLRAVRSVQLKIAEVGPKRAMKMGMGRLRRRRVGRDGGTPSIVTGDVGRVTRKTMQQRLEALAGALGMSIPDDNVDVNYLVDLVSCDLTSVDRSRVWLTLAATRAQCPLQAQFDAFWRNVDTLGGRSALYREVRAEMRRVRSGGASDVRIVRRAVVVDVHHTAKTELATGIQRVVRKATERWARTHEIVLVGWDKYFSSLRALSDDERENALHGTVPEAKPPAHKTVIIPMESHYLLPELALEEGRTGRMACMARESGNITGVVGHDCVPITSAETVGEGMEAVFAGNLVAVRHFTRIAVTSRASEAEYEGWKRMLGGAGWPGPDIRRVGLAAEAEDVTDEQLAAAREALSLDEGERLVLCVGSHEPRKNHLPILYAAETLWREGVDFSLRFIGGNSWKGDAFREQVAALVKRGRPVSSISAVSDTVLWSAYRLATATIFPSVNEGFGLPVAESIAVGTPVITSGFGSMKEIAEGGGAILVDPRDDDDVARALREALTDSALMTKLRKEAEGRSIRTWDEYASELWDYFVGDTHEEPMSPPRSLHGERF